MLLDAPTPRTRRHIQRDRQHVEVHHLQTQHRQELRGKTMNHKDILAQAVTTLRSRTEQYGAEEDVMDRACKIFENITGVEMSLYEGAIFMHSYEMARVKRSRRNMPSVLNSIDYLALSAQFSAAELNMVLEDSMEGITEMAAKLSPVIRTTTDAKVTPPAEEPKK